MPKFKLAMDLGQQETPKEKDYKNIQQTLKHSNLKSLFPDLYLVRVLPISSVTVSWRAASVVVIAAAVSIVIPVSVARSVIITRRRA